VGGYGGSWRRWWSLGGESLSEEEDLKSGSIIELSNAMTSLYEIRYVTLTSDGSKAFFSDVSTVTLRACVK
jgi:hypothetical protein